MQRKRNKAENTVERAYKGVLYPDREQQVLIGKTFGCCRFVYNRFLDERIRTYRESGRTLSYNEQCTRLPVMKADPGTEYLKEADSTALQNSARDLQEAIDGFFRGLKNGDRKGFPKFKRKHSGRQSYRSTCTNGNIRLTDRRHIRLPKLGDVKCRFPREPEGRILNASVIREADGRYEVTVVCESPRPEALEKTGKAAGIDLGVRTLAVTSEGKECDSPKAFGKDLKKLIRAQRKLSRKTKGSRNREKQRKAVAKIHRKIRDRRLDACHKMTRELIRDYDVICMEDLDVKGMFRGRFAKEVSDAAFGEIRRQLLYKADWYGRKLILTDRWYPSSQTCSCCGYVNGDIKDLRIRKWKCPRCGAFHDRDVNAARNILAEGLKQLV